LAQNAKLTEEAGRATSASNSASTEELVSLKAQIKDLKAENDALEAELSAAISDNRQLSAAANGNDHSAELSKAKARIAELEQKVRTMSAARSAMTSEAPAVQGDELMMAIVAAAQKKIDSMVNEVQETAHNAVAQLQSDVDSASVEVEDTRNQIHDIRDRYLSMLKNQMKVFAQMGDE